MNAMQMTLFAVPEPEPPKPEPPPPVGCASTTGGGQRRRKPPIYLKGGFVLCEKHMRDSVRSEMSAAKESGKRHPLVLFCEDGFKAVKQMGREDHRSLGEHRRVQVCRDRQCRAVFAVHWLWTGEPTPCPACRNAALREILEETQAIPQHPL